MRRAGLTWNGDPRVKPPFGAAVWGPDMPLGTGLLCAFLYNERAGAPSVIGAVMPATSSNGTPGWDSAATGVVRSYLAVTDRDTSVASLPTTFQSACTIAMIRRKRDTTLRACSHFAVNDAGNRCQAHMPYSDSTVYWDYGGAGAPNRLTSSYSVTTQLERWVFTGGPLGSAIYLNGTLQASQGTAITTSAAGAFQVNGWSGAGSTGDVVDLEFCGIWGRQWTDDDAREWFRAPYAFLRPIVRRRYFVPASGGSPVGGAAAHRRALLVA